MKVFLSYSDIDKVIAGRIRRELKKYGLSVFLAHDDIEPSEEWVERILRELNNCDVFLPILTNNFDSSLWTDQESGIALILEKLIIPLKINVNPHGFLQRYQALRININSLEDSCEKLIRTIASKKTHGRLLREALIKQFAKSDSFAESGSRAKFLVSLKDFSSLQIKKIVQAVINNSQIYSSFDARDELRVFVRKHKNSIDSALLDEFSRFIR